MEILSLFKKEGFDFLKSVKKIRQEQKKYEEKAKENEGHFSFFTPYTQGQFQMVTETVNIEGDMKIKGDIEIEDDRQEEKREQKMEKQGGRQHSTPVSEKEEQSELNDYFAAKAIDCYKEIRKAYRRTEEEVWKREAQLRDEHHAKLDKTIEHVDEVIKHYRHNEKKKKKI